MSHKTFDYIYMLGLRSLLSVLSDAYLLLFLPNAQTIRAQGVVISSLYGLVTKYVRNKISRNFSVRDEPILMRLMLFDGSFFKDTEINFSSSYIHCKPKKWK